MDEELWVSNNISLNKNKLAINNGFAALIRALKSSTCDKIKKACHHVHAHSHTRTRKNADEGFFAFSLLLWLL